jgi:hypothetical protein
MATHKGKANATDVGCRSIYFLDPFIAGRILSFFVSPASESAIAMACFRFITFGPFLEPECNVPALNLCSSSLMRFCFAFLGAFGVSFGMPPSLVRLTAAGHLVFLPNQVPLYDGGKSLRYLPHLMFLFAFRGVDLHKIQ